MTIPADKVLSNPEAYRMAAESGGAALSVLPRFAIYNRLNAWGRHRDLPHPATETFHQWYARNRTGTHPQETLSHHTELGSEGGA